MAKSHGIDLDEILLELGQFGRYQIRVYSLVLIPIIFSALYNSQYIFAAGDVRYRCQVPQCESSPATFEAGWASWALPEGSQCERYKAIGPGCTAADFLPGQVERCDAWVYEDHNSIVSEFNLACEPWKRTLVGTTHSVGLFFALPLTSYISDTFGRRTAFILTAVLAGAMGLIRSFTTGYIIYLVFEFLDATLGSGVYSTGFILALEMVGLNRRVLGGNIISMSYAIGQVICALIAWVAPYWRTYTRIIYTPSLLFFVYYFLIEESVRWLLSKGRKKEAAGIIFRAAAINDRKLSPETTKKLTDDDEVTSKRDDFKQLEESSKGQFLKILKSKTMVSRMAICSFWWITVTFIYYGLSINSVSLAGNMYVNYILTALVEIPGYFMSVFTLDRFGRKKSIMTSYFICGIALLAFPFVPQRLHWIQTSLNMLGKLCISMTFSSIYIYTSELFPTNARHRLLGFCSMVGRVGSIVAPMTPLLMSYMPSLPYILFGAMAATSGLLMILTPETLHTKLPDTVEEAENIAPAASTRNRPSIGD